MTDYSENLLDKSFDKGTNTALNFFWLGFIIYTISWVVTTTSYVNNSVFHTIQFLGVLLFVPTAIRLIHWKFDNSYLKYIFIFYCTWLFTVIIRGFLFDYESLKYLIVDAYGGIFVYLAPLILLFPKNSFYLKKAFNVIVILGIFYVVYDIYFIKDLLYRFGTNLTSQAIVEYFSKTLSIPSGFLLLTYIYHSNKRKLFALFVIVLTFSLAAIRARRGLMFMSINILIFSFFIYYYAHKAKIIIFLFSLLLILFIYFLGAKIYNENRNGLFGYITERLDEDTRTLVEVYFYLDMNTKDWIIGKGINGTYYSPGINNDDYRTGIETDYLSIILKGGIISLGLLLLIAIPAIFKGLFYSKNLLSKAAGIWILFYLGDLYPAPVTDFTLNYLLVWISIGICYSKEIRNTPEITVKKLLSK